MYHTTLELNDSMRLYGVIIVSIVYIQCEKREKSHFTLRYQKDEHHALFMTQWLTLEWNTIPSIYIDQFRHLCHIEF